MQLHPKTAIAIISGTVKAAIGTSNLAGRPIFTGSIRTQAHEMFGENGAWAYPETAQI